MISSYTFSAPASRAESDQKQGERTKVGENIARHNIWQDLRARKTNIECERRH